MCLQKKCVYQKKEKRILSQQEQEQEQETEALPKDKKDKKEKKGKKGNQIKQKPIY